MLKWLSNWWEVLNRPLIDNTIPTKLKVSSNDDDLSMYNIYFWPETGMMMVEYPASSINFHIDDKNIEKSIKNIYTDMQKEVLTALRKSKKVIR